MPLGALGFEGLDAVFVNDMTYVLSDDNVQPQNTGRLELFQVEAHPFGLIDASVYTVNLLQPENA